MITLSYYEESEHVCDEKSSTNLKAKFIYDGVDNDFVIKYGGERVSKIISGEMLYSVDPKITEVNIWRNYDGLIIEYKNSSHITTYRMVINLHSLDYFSVNSSSVINKMPTKLI